MDYLIKILFSFGLRIYFSVYFVVYLIIQNTAQAYIQTFLVTLALCNTIWNNFPWLLFLMLTPTVSPGQREVLPDIRSLHDTFVPWGPNRNCALLHHGDLCVCSFHDQRWDGKAEQQQRTTPLIAPLIQWSRSSIVSHVSLHLFPVHSERRASQVAQTGSREAPKHVPPGNGRRRHRSSPFLSLCGFQIPGRRLGLPQGGMRCSCKLLWEFCA